MADRPARIAFGDFILFLIVLAQAVAFIFFHDLPSKVGEHNKATARMNDAAKHLESERIALRSESNRLEKKRLELESSTLKMKGEKDTLEDAIRRSKLERSRFEQEKQLLEDKRKLLEQEKEELREEREKWEKAREGLESSTLKMKGERGALEDAIRHSKLERSRFKREKQLLEDKRQSLKQEKQLLEDKRQSLEQEKQLLEDKRKLLEQEKEELKEEREKWEKAREGLESSTLKMKGEKDKLEAVIRRSKPERSRLKREKQLLEDKRKLLEQEKEKLREQWEKWEKAREDSGRVPQGASWSSEPIAAWDCRTYGKREYWATLENVPEGWTDMDACMNMPVEIKGVNIRRPDRCEYAGDPLGIRGIWMVNWGQTDCKPRLEDVTDTGCTNQGSGTRRIEAQVVGINNRPEQDWRLLCESTPLTWNYITYNSPTYCEPRLFGTKYGTRDFSDYMTAGFQLFETKHAIWDIPDHSC